MLRDATLINANLKNTNVHNARLDQANLRQANLDRSSLNNATLAGAWLNSVSLVKANLVGADLSSANLEIVDLRGAVLDHSTNFKGSITTGCIVDRYQLDQLTDYGDLSIDNRLSMTIKDGVAELRASYSGFWQWIHLMALLVFLFPTAHFFRQVIPVSTLSSPFY